jgi:diguanylate cyclase (GGDEF)-like protein
MEPETLVLVCDHRGAGVDALFRGMGTIPWRVAWSASIAESLERVAAERPEVIVLDPLVEGGRAEAEVLRAPRPGGGNGEKELGSPPPGIVMLFDSGRPEPALATGATLRSCAFDAIPRGSRPEELRMRIERVLAECKREKEIAELRHRALHDDGTGLLRPRAFQTRLVEHYGAAERHELDLALVLLDLDGFGAINKRFDHTMGDRILTRVSEAIRASLRAEDVAGRIGGDEFAVVLPYTRKVEAAHVSRRLLEKIRDASGMYPGAGERIDVAASLGFETYDGKDLESVAVLRAHAEAALRAAKMAGGNRGMYFRAMK